MEVKKEDWEGFKKPKPELIKIIEPYISPFGHKCRRGLFRCSCGVEFECMLTLIKTGKTKSCGCYFKYVMSLTVTHGLSTHKMYAVWHNMMNRCYEKTDKSFRWYGAIGIKVCKRWGKMENFFADMQDGFKEGLTLERKNSKKDYCKTNCRWATTSEQARNKKNNIFIEINGVKKVVTDWSKELGGEGKLVGARLLSGWSPERAATTPAKKKRKKQENLTYNGKTKTLSEWAKEYGLHINTLGGRLLRLKWNFEKALTTPTIKWK